MTRLFAIVALCLHATCATAAEIATQPKDFVARRMASLTLPIVNPDFSDVEAGTLVGWTFDAQTSPSSALPIVGKLDGRAGIEIAAAGEERSIYQDVPVRSLPSSAGALSLSAWVWSDTAGSATLAISNMNGAEVRSAFHSGRSRWEYLTVVLPYEQAPDALRLTASGRKGIARFSAMHTIATFDDRFTKTLPDACSPLRERATYAKNGRIRIVVVGNSTVNGFVHADKRVTFPYALQLKLEALYPGRFDVVNFGICAWHLAPQVVTLDHNFHLNLVCDGAVWCSPARPFSHRNALDIQQNEDRNTPTIRDLTPDVIVFAGMWNDVWRTLKYWDWGIPPKPDEVNRIEGEPASVAYLRSVFRYIDHPTPQSLAAAEAVLLQATQPLDTASVDSLSFNDYAALKSSPLFAELVKNARVKFRYLSSEFIRRSQAYAKVWSLVLPERFADSFEEAAARLVAGGVMADVKLNKFLMGGYVDALADRIQREELTGVSRTLGAKSLDLSTSFRAQYGAMPLNEQFALGYFLENLEDNVHLGYRGNEWIADRIYEAFAEDIAQMARATEWAPDTLEWRFR
jgi:hypothetical protein